MANITMLEAITRAHAWEMSHDPSVVVLGEDVGVNGGIFRATAGLQEQFGKDRVQDTPLAEGMIAGMSNFGMIAGRYATPVVVPPAVAILGCGRLSHDVIATQKDRIEVHLRMPLSLTFDHRCVTGGEAARFLAAVIRDLQKGN
jgi:pyruvate dehydrogenase E2 component (dihydrolipoamide acetyltransferase)